MPKAITSTGPDDRRERHRRRVEWERSHPPDVFTGVPSFLRASTHTARRSREGYREPGFQHGHHVRRLTPLRIEDDDWQQLIDDFLVPLAEAEEIDRVAEWVHRHFPYVMQHVPRPRVERYVAGFIKGLFED